MAQSTLSAEQGLHVGPACLADAGAGVRWSGWQIGLAAIAISLLYVPFLGTNFDFADDGVLVYPSGESSVRGYLDVVRMRTVEDFETRGPFRPVAWAIWMGQAELFGSDPWAWRVARQLWIALSAAVLLVLLMELGIGGRVAFFVTLLAMWNPYRVEIWLGLNFMEGAMMPIALTGLICAIRAARAEHAWFWDVTGFGCMLLAVLSKNVFLAMIPAQLFLRVAEPGFSWSARLRRHGGPALLLALVGVVPVVHFFYYKLNFRPGQYEVGWSPDQPWRLLRNMGAALAVDFLAPVLIVGTWLLWKSRARPAAGLPPALTGHTALVAGLLLFVAGFAVYLPVKGVAARYVVPGIWGLDILLALFFSRLAQASLPVSKRWLYGLGGCAVVAIAVVNVGKQTKTHARIELLWDALHAFEEHAPAGAGLGWVSVNYLQKTGNLLEFGEGFHFARHLAERGRANLDFHFLDAQGNEETSPFGMETAVSPSRRPQWLITGTEAPPPGVWNLVEKFERPYWAGLRAYRCYLWGSGMDTRPAAH